MTGRPTLPGMRERGDSVRSVSVSRVEPERIVTEADRVATEEALEIRAGGVEASGADLRSVSVTMRTPGDDYSLSAGFFFTEGLIDSGDDIRSIEYCGTGGNTIAVRLDAGVLHRLDHLSRNFFASSSCGVCGKGSLEALEIERLWPIDAGKPRYEPVQIRRLPALLRREQEIFDVTGGLHAAGLVDGRGELVQVAEDVGRHNALDKLIGWVVRERRLPLDDHAVVVSGRVSFELVQKASRAGVGMIVAVSAPSSLAVELAEKSGMTLIGFARGETFNIYTCPERIG